MPEAPASTRSAPASTSIPMQNGSHGLLTHPLAVADASIAVTACVVGLPTPTMADTLPLGPPHALHCPWTHVCVPSKQLAMFPTRPVSMPQRTVSPSAEQPPVA